MTEMTRKKNTGEATTNGGEFGSKQNTESEASLTPAVSRTVTNFDLQVGDVLIGGHGSRVTIDDVEPSSSMSGFMAVETEFGTLYLDAELESDVAVDDKLHINPIDSLSAPVRDRIARLMEEMFEDEEPLLYVPADGFQEGYADIVAVADSDSFKFTIDPDSEISYHEL